jgi:hypothetical protein
MFATPADCQSATQQLAKLRYNPGTDLLVG